MKYLKNFNENYNVNKMFPIATNEIYWQWEYDSDIRIAKILFDSSY